MSDTTRLQVAQPKRGVHSHTNSQSNPFDTPFDEPDWDDESLDGNDHGTDFPDDKSDVSRMTQWPTFSNVAAPPMPQMPQMKTRKSVKRSSVIKPTRDKSRRRQKKQNERAGIKLNTDVARHRPLAPAVPQPKQNAAGPLPLAETARFVDLAALQSLESRTAPNNGGFWKNLLGNAPNPPAAAQPSPDQQGSSNEGAVANADPIPGFANRRAKGLKPPSLTMEGDLSPSDRPIVIGISIPSATMQQHITSPQTARSETSNILNCYESQTPRENAPETPVIVITPAEVSYWSPISANTATPQSRRVPSSVYSRPMSYPHTSNQQEEIPPMPQIAPHMLKGQKTGRESVGTIFAEDDDDDEIVSARPKRLRIGTGAILEEDQEQILTRKNRSESDGSEKRPKSMLSPHDRRTSNGWWNTILSPFLTRSNTVTFPPTARQGDRSPVPDMATPDTKSGNGDFRFWEKALSPKSPLSSTTIASDDWWDNRNTIDGTPKGDGLDSKFKDGIYTYKAEESYGTLPLALSRSTRVAASANNQQQNPDVDPNGGTGELQRDQSLAVRSDRSSILSPADREAPFMLDDPSVKPVDRSAASTNTGNQQTPPQSSSAAPTDMSGTSATTQSQTRRPAENAPKVVTPAAPPPYSPPRPGFPKYAAVYPPGHSSSSQQPQSPGPLSPGLQQAMSSTGAIALTDVPLTPATRRVINLNSGYPTLPPPTANRTVNPVDLEIASEKARKIDAKRRRHEKEEVVARKAGRLWRGRGCISNRGCYGRTGPEGRKRRRCWLGVVGVLIGLTILIVLLATQLNKSTPRVEIPSQWVNLTVFPPMYTGVSMVSSTANNVADTGCVYPKTVWSCALPKELQASVAPSKPDQPKLKLFIQWDNSSAANATWGGPTGNAPARRSAGNAANAGQFLKHLALKARQAVTFSPSPAPPSNAEQGFLGNATDGVVSDNKAGERTPFYITLLDPQAAAETSAKLSTRQEKGNKTSDFPGFGASIPPPELDADGTAAPANLLPTPKQQPLRLFDRGLPTEHYGFYSYFNRSIFLKSTALLNETNLGDGEVPGDLNGGCTESEARFRCTWSQTRFLVQMWTRKDTSAVLLNSTPASGSSGTVTTTILGQENSAFPYPITITTDRHGGDPTKKGVHCYEIDERQKVVAGSGKVRPEFRAFGGALVNKAPTAFDTSSNAALGGFDGGDSGCSCKWANWHSVA
ncbi:hypothetical protein V493_04088 [Pseudogymnoascus sp. VKM F-4281 (FW-2241)]|nr:hypothetical protein V493_04088 [Pseudogymnoascus sp. VKM F-4281 (FW-2241)]